MRAMMLDKAGAPLSLRRVEPKAPGPDEVAIDVEACGHGTAPSATTALIDGIARKVDAVG